MKRKKTELKKYHAWWEKQKMHETFTAEQGWMARAKIAHVENMRLLDEVQQAMEDLISITDAVADNESIEFTDGKPEGVLVTYPQIDLLCRSIMKIAVAHDMIDLGDEDAV